MRAVKIFLRRRRSLCSSCLQKDHSRFSVDSRRARARRETRKAKTDSLYEQRQPLLMPAVKRASKTEERKPRREFREATRVHDSEFITHFGSRAN